MPDQKVSNPKRKEQHKKIWAVEDSKLNKRCKKTSNLTKDAEIWIRIQDEKIGQSKVRNDRAIKGKKFSRTRGLELRRSY